MSQITDEIAKWPQGGPQHSAARLRTADAVAKERADTVDWLFACFPALTEVLTAEQIASIGQGGADARAYLAAREKER